MHDGTRPLVRLVGAHTHPSSVGALRRGHTGIVADAGSKTLYLGEVVPPVDSCLRGVADTLVGSSVATLTDIEINLSLGDGIEADDVTIPHLSTLGDGVSPHIVLRCRLQVFQPVDGTIVVEDTLGGIIADGRFWLFAPAKALLRNLACRNSRDFHTSKRHSSSPGIACISHHGGLCLYTMGYHETQC